MRLDRYLSQATGLTRSLAQREIRHGGVSVDGEVVRSPAAQLGADPRVTWRGEAVAPRGPVYLMLHKPPGYVCSHDDAAHPSVYTLVDGHPPEALHVAGRLDADTTGLVLITDDGQWSHRVTAPRHHCTKTYLVGVAEPLTEMMLQALAAGVLLRGEAKPTLPAAIELIDAHTLRLGIEEGRYHQVKRMLAAVGNRVVTLHREAVGPVVLDPALAPGQSRPLSVDEIAVLAGGG